jgi:hypothetical protein
MRFTINFIYRGETRIALEHVNRTSSDAAPHWPTGDQNDVYRVEIDGSPSITQETAIRFTDGSGRDAATAGCLATGLRALNAVPAVNALPQGWVTPLDLPLIPGEGKPRPTATCSNISSKNSTGGLSIPNASPANAIRRYDWFASSSDGEGYHPHAMAPGLPCPTFTLSAGITG